MKITEQSTRHGIARLYISEVIQPKYRLVLHHGAGGGVDSADLAYLAQHARSAVVVRVEQPWRVAGKRIAPSSRILDEVAIDLTYPFDDLPLIVGGRSAGARVACRTSLALGAKAALLLAFPLHPPGKPEKSRAGELKAEIPLVVIQGEKDPFGRPPEFPEGVEVISVPGKGHDLAETPFEIALEHLGFG